MKRAAAILVFVILASACGETTAAPANSTTTTTETSTSTTATTAPSTTVKPTTTEAPAPEPYRSDRVEDFDESDWRLFESVFESTDRGLIGAQMDTLCDIIDEMTYRELAKLAAGAVLDNDDDMDLYGMLSMSVLQRCPTSPAAVEWKAEIDETIRKLEDDD